MNSVPGRPEPGEYASYAAADIAAVEGDDIFHALRNQLEDTLHLLRPIDDARATALVYAPGKWSLKQVVGHLSDDERIFAYRCLCLARNDARPLPGFEEKDYVRFAAFDRQPFSALLDEFAAVRESTIALFRGFTPEAWVRRGIVNGYNATVRGLAFHLAGHELHHLRIVREKYLNELDPLPTSQF
jgi:hypothetical protein